MVEESITPNPSPSGGVMVSTIEHPIAAWVHGFVMQRVDMAMSLEEAWSHVKALWPNAERLDRHDGKFVACWKDSTIVVGPMFFYRIDPGIVDWPEGVLQFEPEKRTIDNPKEFENQATKED
jgi:hypothetical protein